MEALRIPSGTLTTGEVNYKFHGIPLYTHICIYIYIYLWLYIHISSRYPVYPHHTILVAYIGNLNWRYLSYLFLACFCVFVRAKWIPVRFAPKMEPGDASAHPRTFGSADLRKNWAKEYWLKWEISGNSTWILSTSYTGSLWHFGNKLANWRANGA